MKKLFLVLIFIMFFTISCSKSEIDNAETTDITNEIVTEQNEVVPDLPENVNYNGTDFVILITGNTENNWQKNDFKADEQTGEVLNDARYVRNTIVEETYGVKLKTIEEYGSAKGEGSGYQLVMRGVMAGDTTYDACMINVYDISNLACSGYLYDLNSLPYIDLSKPWWDQKANEDLSILGKMFFTTGDISTADNDATYCILFNKKLVDDYKLESPYEIVKAGKWTFDKFTEMGKHAVADLNGDGVYDKEDSFAAIVWDDTIMGAVNGSLEKCGYVDNDGKIQLSLYSEKIVDVLKKYTDFVFNKELCYQYQRVSYDITDPINMFSNDRAMFFMQMLDLTSYFRDMETDYGILPYPKYNETQTDYGHTIGSWHSMFLCVPSLVKDIEMCGVILEALAFESMKTVTPAYYDKTLIGKYFRDDESIEMLDIILSTRVYDLGWYYQIGKYNDEILYMVYNGNPNFSSMYATHETVAIADIERINGIFAENIFQ